MGKVTVYQYQMLNTNLGEPRKARRWGTREAIEERNGSADAVTLDLDPFGKPLAPPSTSVTADPSEYSNGSIQRTYRRR